MKYLINCDWLGFSVHLCESQSEKDNHEFVMAEPQGFRLLQFTGTNIYKKRAILYNLDGVKILTILWEPFSKVLPYDSMLVELANSLLYSDYSFVMDLLYQIHPCTWQNLSRIDVCCDFVCGERESQIIQELARNHIYVAGKREGSQFYDFELATRNLRIAKCLNWGSKCSNIKWKLYNKTLELCEIDSNGHQIWSKPYIRNMWEQNGFDINHVWRLEVSITSASKYEYQGKPLGWIDVINYSTICNLFAMLYETRFVMRKNEGHKDHSNDKRVWLIPSFGQVSRLYERESENTREVAEYVPLLRTLMDKIELPEIVANENMLNVCISTIKDVVNIGKLQAYFQRTYGKKCSEYLEEIKNNICYINKT